MKTHSKWWSGTYGQAVDVCFRTVTPTITLLTMADCMEVVSVADEGRGKAEGVGLPRSGMGVTSTLLSYAVDFDAGLTVMGGYCHSRLREIVLGSTPALSGSQWWFQF